MYIYDIGRLNISKMFPSVVVKNCIASDCQNIVNWTCISHIVEYISDSL